MLLALDTSSAAVTVALHDGTRVVSEHGAVDPLAHGELLAPALRQVLDDASAHVSDLTRIVVGVGPGPFTGLRVGIMTARTLAHVRGIEAVGVCSLDVIAAEAVSSGAVGGPFQVATDARRKEVYIAAYESEGSRVSGPAVMKPADANHDLVTAGRGGALYADVFSRAVAPEYPSAAVMASMVMDQRVELHSTEPLYLRRPDAVEPGARKPAS